MSLSDPTDAPKWVPITTAADHFAVSADTIRRWLASGVITGERIGPKLIRVDLSSIESTPIEVVPNA